MYQKMSGAGEPPSELQLMFMASPSVATGVLGVMTGGPGLTSTVTSTFKSSSYNEFLLCMLNFHFNNNQDLSDLLPDLQT